MRHNININGLSHVFSRQIFVGIFQISENHYLTESVEKKIYNKKQAQTILVSFCTSGLHEVHFLCQTLLVIPIFAMCLWLQQKFYKVCSAHSDKIGKKTCDFQRSFPGMRSGRQMLKSSKNYLVSFLVSLLRHSS